MELFTQETIGNYTSDPYLKNDNKYAKQMQEIRKDHYSFSSCFTGDDYQHDEDTFKAFKKVCVVLVGEYWKTKELEKNFTALK